MSELRTLEVPIAGMDCAECTQHVQHAIAKLPGVQQVDVFLGAEKARIQMDAAQVDMPAIRAAVKEAGYSVPEVTTAAQAAVSAGDFNRKLTILLVGLFVGVVGIVVVGEWMGVFEWLNERIPFAIGLVIVLAGGYPVFLNVIRATLKRQIISHTLMTLGVLAALAVGQWVTAAVVVIFMRVGDYVENFTTESARRAVKDLTALAPQTARVERDGAELEIPVGQVIPGETIIVRPGEKIPVDGEVLSGQATVDQAAITGESMPVEVAAGAQVFAATLAQLGSLRIRAERTGADTTFGRVIQMVEEAEAHRADVQRFADKFSAWYLPIVAGIAALTFLISRNPLSTAAVLLVACSCSIALATPMAMLASIGASAKRGLLIKGGKYLELLARADVLLVDKTGTLTLGQPAGDGRDPAQRPSRPEALRFAAAAERYSEHPLAEAVRALARAEGVALDEPEDFEAIPGEGVRARVGGQAVAVGTCACCRSSGIWQTARQLEAQGKTLLYLAVDGGSGGDLCRRRYPAPRSARGIGGSAGAGHPPHRAADRGQRAHRGGAGGEAGRILPGRAAAGGQDRDCEGIPAAGAYRADGGRRRERRPGPGAGGRGDRHGRGRRGCGHRGRPHRPDARRLGAGAGGAAHCPAHDAGGEDEPGLYGAVQRRRADPGGAGIPAADAGRRGAVAAGYWDHGEQREVDQAEELTTNFGSDIMQTQRR